MVGDVARVGKASQPNDEIGQHGETKKNTNGVGVSKFVENNEMESGINRVECHIRNGLDMVYKGDRALSSIIVVKYEGYGSTCICMAADVGSANRCSLTAHVRELQEAV